MRKAALLYLLFTSSLSVFSQIRIGAPRSEEFVLSYSKPREFEIGGITTSGTKALDPNALIAITGLKVGDKVVIPSDKLSNALKKLWTQGILSDVELFISKIEGDYVFLNFELTEKPRLSKFSFSGIKKGEADDLREKINLVRGRVISDALIRNTQNTIYAFYDEKGFRNAKVTITEEDDPALTGSVVLKIAIKKNNKVKIGSIDFEGNALFKDEELRRKLKDTKEKRPYRIFKTSKFLKDKYESDKERIINFYNAKGYRDARIVGDSIYDYNKELVNIKINLEEGNKYYFRNIYWKGNYIYDDQRLSSVLGIKSGDVYNLDNLEKRLNYNPSGIDVSSLYMDNGYLFFSIEPVEVLIEGDSIDIEMRIYEGAQATIDQVTLAGNNKTNDAVIMREIRTIPGQKFSREQIIRSNREIASLGYFNPETIQINPVPNMEKGTVDIEYVVEERPSDQVELSGGWGGFFGFIGSAGVTFNNFSTRNFFKKWDPLPSGDGQRLGIRFQANGRRFQSYSLSFTEPWLGGRRPNSLTGAISYFNQNQIDGITNKRISRLGILQNSLTLSRRLPWPDDYFTLSNTLEMKVYFTENFPVANGINNDRFYNFNFSTALARVSIGPNPQYPQRGSNMAAIFTVTPPYSLYNGFTVETPLSQRFRVLEYYKIYSDNWWYLPLAFKDKLVLVTRAHFGFLGSYRPELGTSPFERFSLGGDGISGFNFVLGTDVIGLRGYPNGGSVGASPNGVAYDKLVAELRFPLSLNPQATIFMLGFVEAGNNFASIRSFDPFRLNRSAGVGARIFMPAFGMIGVDYGYGFDELVPGSGVPSGRQFHFTIGQQIR